MSCQLPSGLLVTSSDVLEEVSIAEVASYAEDEELILFATECDLEVKAPEAIKEYFRRLRDMGSS